MANFYLYEDTQFFDQNGNPLSGGKIATFQAGTSTPLATFTDSTGGTPNANPVILDSAGRAQIWLSAAAYKLTISTSGNSLLQTIDNYNPNAIATTVTSLTSTGAVTLQQSTAATSGANQSSNILEIDANYWNGAASALDKWTIQDVLGAGTNPTSTLTVTHSGSSGTAAINLPALVSATVNGALTAQSINGRLCVGAAPCYANIAAAVAAAGSTNKTIIEIDSAPNYTGTDCGAAQDNITYIDYRGMSPTPCNTNNSIHINSGTAAVPHMIQEVILNVASPTASSAITSTQFSTLVTGTLPGAPGLVDGTAATAFTTGNMSGTLGTLRGAEIAASINGSGGAVTNAEGVVGYVTGSGGTTTTIGTAKGIVGLGCNGQTFGVAPTNCYGGYFWPQNNKATARNYSAVFGGPALVQYEGSFASASQIDAEDNGGTARTWLKIDSANNTIIQAVAAQPLALRDNGATARLQVNANGTVTIPTAQTLTTANVAGSPIVLAGVTSQKAETGADTNVLTFTPPAAAGSYRIRISMAVSAQNTATLGWTATWKDSNGSAQAPTNLSLFQSGVAAPALTFTAATNGVYYAELQIDVDSSATNIVVKTTFSGTSIAYKATATIERVI